MTKYKTSKLEHVRAEETGETLKNQLWCMSGTWT